MIYQRCYNDNDQCLVSIWTFTQYLFPKPHVEDIITPCYEWENWGLESKWLRHKFRKEQDWDVSSGLPGLEVQTPLMNKHINI
jgi:hypothetical protein